MFCVAVFVLAFLSTSVSSTVETTCYNQFEYEYNVLQKLLMLEQLKDSLMSTVNELRMNVSSLTEERRQGTFIRF